MNPIQSLIEHLQILPGVGQRTAQKYAVHLLEKKTQDGIKLGQIIEHTLSTVSYCRQCHFFSESQDSLCEHCTNSNKNTGQILVLHHAIDVFYIEKLNSYKGLYHVLGGQISPIDRIGPDDLTIEKLFCRLNESITEIILGTNATIQGEATAHYIAQKAKQYAPHVSITRLASGVPLGSELEYIDAHTLSYALGERQSYDYSD